MKEPLWRLVLCWCAVITFFTFPLILFSLHILSIEWGWGSANRWEEFKGAAGFYHVVAALVFGLAGLNTWDRTVKLNGKKQDMEVKKDKE